MVITFRKFAIQVPTAVRLLLSLVNLARLGLLILSRVLLTFHIDFHARPEEYAPFKACTLWNSRFLAIVASPVQVRQIKVANMIILAQEDFPVTMVQLLQTSITRPVNEDTSVPGELPSTNRVIR